MSNPGPSFNHNRANDLLYGFETYDEDFLCSLITSGLVPQAELDAIREISLTRGVEEWVMLFECASALRDKSRVLRRDKGDTVGETSLIPFLEAALAGNSEACGHDTKASVEDKDRTQDITGSQTRTGVLKKRGQEKGVSPFWADVDDAKEKIHRQQSRTCSPSHDQMLLDSADEKGAEEEENGASRDRGSHGDEVPQMPRSPKLEPLPPLGPLEEEDVLWGVAATSSRRDASPSLPTSEADIQPPISQTVIKRPAPSQSPFFSTPARQRKRLPTTPPSTQNKKPRLTPGFVSRLPIPPLSSPTFGLIQEELATSPFRLLIAVTFLIKTHGRTAIPVFRKLISRYPGPEELATADPAEVTALIRPLGLANVRCAAIQRYARGWLERPPCRERRYGVKNYPRWGDGKGVKAGEEFGPEDEEVGDEGNVVRDAKERALGCAWEIGHLTQGPYAIDSWRIFCRDILLGRSRDWTGSGEQREGFQPEWMRVLPKDKELRACLRWMWMKEGWEWDPETGEREPLREELRRAVDEGRVGYDDNGNLVITESGGDVVG